MKQNIYDSKKFSLEYDKMRKENKGYNANDLIEIPIFRSMLSNVKNIMIIRCWSMVTNGNIIYSMPMNRATAQ